MTMVLDKLNAVYSSTRCVKADDGMRVGSFLIFSATEGVLGLGTVLGSQNHYIYNNKFNWGSRTLAARTQTINGTSESWI